MNEPEISAVAEQVTEETIDELTDGKGDDEDGNIQQ